MSETSQLLSKEPSSPSDKFLDVGQMYLFHPAQHFSKLTLCKTRSTADPAVHVGRQVVFAITERKDTWRYVYCAGHQGWINVSDSQQGSNIFERVTSFPRHKDWRGNNLFFLSGRIMLGSDGKFFAATNLVASVVVYLFHAHFAPVVPYSPIVTTVGAVLWATTLISLWLVAFIEPGIIPRLPAHEKVRRLCFG